MINGKQKLIFILPLCSVLLLLLKGLAGGYVLQGPHVLELVTKKLGVSHRLQVTQHLIQRDSRHDRGFVRFTEAVYYDFPDRFRSEIQSDTYQRIFLENREQRLSVMDGAIQRQPESPFDWYKDPLLCRTREKLHTRLLRRGIDVSISSLGRFKEQVVIVIGARYPDETVSQLWIDKESFLPVRLLIVTEPSGYKSVPDLLDVRYENWQTRDDIWYPMDILFFKNGGVVREIIVEKIAIDPVFSPELMDRERLISQYPTMVSPPNAEESADDELNEVQKTIESFKNKFE